LVNFKTIGDTAFCDFPEAPKGEPVNIEFQLEKTITPKEIGISNDTRSLGIKIEVVD
jgi:hypothetical protein